MLVSMVLVTTTPLASTVVACLRKINCKCQMQFNLAQSQTILCVSFMVILHLFLLVGAWHLTKLLHVQRLGYSLL